MRMIFMRHGESTCNVQRLCNGDPTRDIRLTRRGQAQVEATAERLKTLPIDLVIASEFPRAQQSAAIVNQYHGAPLHIDARVNDRRNGFDGRPISEYLQAVGDDPLGFRPDNGETYGELIARVDRFLADLAHSPGQCVLVVTHHEVLQVVFGRRQGFGADAMWRFWIDTADTFEWELPR